MDAGEVLFNGMRLNGLKPHQICQQGLVRTFQIVKPFLQLTVLDNVVVAALNRIRTSREAVQKALNTIDFLGLKI